MIFISAGHNKRLIGGDPGAIGVCGIKEADLTVELRNLIVEELKLLGADYRTDVDSETLSQYIARIKPGSRSVVCDLHFNSSVNLATGVEVIVKDGSSQLERKLANEICKMIAATCNVANERLVNRGVKSEAQSHRGRLGILHTNAGISVLPEICFINNPKDLQLYQANKVQVAQKLAMLLKMYDDMKS